MRTIEFHRLILADPLRNKAFYDAFKQIIKKGESDVVDIGAGTGFLSFLASRLGAKSCTLIEVDNEILTLSKSVAKRNNIQNCKFIFTHSSKVHNIPKVDIVVSETLGGYALEENIIENLNDARKFLKQGGIIIPGKLEQFIAPVSGDTLHKSLVVPWTTMNKEYKLNFSDVSKISLANMFQKPVPKEDIYKPQQFTVKFDSINFYEKNKSTRNYRVFWRYDEDVTIYGLCAWWKADLVPGVSLTTSPFSPLTHWEQHPVSCKKDQQMDVEINSDTRVSVGVQVDWKVTLKSGPKQLLTFTNNEHS